MGLGEAQLSCSEIRTWKYQTFHRNGIIIGMSDKNFSVVFHFSFKTTNFCRRMTDAFELALMKQVNQEEGAEHT